MAAARMGCTTLLLTISLDHLALTPCNPSFGGPAKANLMREIDALGGEMARVVDRCTIQVRLLNTAKGPAMRAIRAQVDKRLYSRAMHEALEQTANLYLFQDVVTNLEQSGGLLAVTTRAGASYLARAVILATGTSLAGRIITGEMVASAGRVGEEASVELPRAIKRLGLRTGRLKTGTPPRVDARSVDFSATTLQPGSAQPLYFSDNGALLPGLIHGDPASVYPGASKEGWRPQLPCYQIRTNERTHAQIRANLHRAPLFSGMIEGVGPRYCPSIEDKIVRFADRDSHILFLEPEGWQTNEMYVQGANTSLPLDIQESMLRTIPALSNVALLRPGYAVEYDYVPADQTAASLMSKSVRGLFLAGQINGTSGYEEAAAQGIVAGINAALFVLGPSVLSEPEGTTESEAAILSALRQGEPLILPRNLAYAGVMVDDLVTSSINEPYRLLSSRAEYRLLLRQDNAWLRLAGIGAALGLVSKERWERWLRVRREVKEALSSLQNRSVLVAAADPHYAQRIPAITYLKRPEVSAADPLLSLGDLSPEAAEQLEIEAKYSSYIVKQQTAANRAAHSEAIRLPESLDYSAIPALRTEAREKLARFRPRTLAQAQRIYGVTPADVAVLLASLKRYGRQRGAAIASGSPPDAATV